MIPTADCVVMQAYIFHEFKFAKHPVVARRFVFNRSVYIACLVRFRSRVNLTSVNRSSRGSLSVSLPSTALPRSLRRPLSRMRT